MLVEVLGKHAQMPGRLQRSYGREDAKEEKDGWHINFAQHANDGHFFSVFGGFAFVQQIGNHPNDTQPKQHAHVGWQVGECFENGHKQQCANAHKQD